MMDDVLSALIGMRAEEMEPAESKLRELREMPADGEMILKLKQLRAAAVNAMHLFRACLPESEAILYSPAGETTPVPSASGMSVTA